MSRGSRARRARRPRGVSRVGLRFEATVGPIAHGGHCVARHEGRAVFVRHALPGERVVVEVTEGTDGDRFWRGDAVEVLEPAADRVPAPCPHAGPDACGGCDFQHVTPAGQRALKTAVVREQLQRLAGVEWDGEVEAVPMNGPVGSEAADDVTGLGWRTRQRYVELPDGRQGMRKHRSHEVVPIDQCLIEGQAPAYDVLGERFVVPAGGFWQVHPRAPETLVHAVLDVLAPQPGESALDLYAGVGLFSRFLLDRVGGDGRVVAVEGDRRATQAARGNCPGIEVATGSVDEVLAAQHQGHFDLVVLDPPRSGAKRQVVEQIVTRTPRAIAYVACDPAALARDVAIFAEHGYRLGPVRAFDLFPMTHHVECVALLEKADSEPR